MFKKSTKSLILIVSLLLSNPSLAEKPVYYVYLAGPEVFLSEPIKAGEDKKNLIRNLSKSQDWPFDLEGLYPLDNEILNFTNNPATGMRIYLANLALMNKAHAVVANMVRFRGPSMDVGTAFEMGYMSGAGKAVFAYYDTQAFYGNNESSGLYKDRVAEYWKLGEEDKSVDADGLHIENFGMTDNLMMVGSLTESGYPLSASFKQAILNVADYFLKHHKTQK